MNTGVELAKKIISLDNRIVNLNSYSIILSNFINNLDPSLKGSVEINLTDDDELIPFSVVKTSFNIPLTKEIAKVLVDDINNRITILKNELYLLECKLTHSIRRFIYDTVSRL